MSASKIISHRGACGSAPENTLASMRKAKALGAEWVEFDTMLSADGHVVVIHDETLKRTTGTAGKVADMDLADLQTLDAGSWFDEAFAGEKIPTLIEVIGLLGELGLGAVVEIKPSQGLDEETAAKTVEIVKECWPTSLPTPILSSFSDISLAIAQHHAPELPRALNINKKIEAGINKANTLECVALHCQHPAIDSASARKVLDAEIDLRCFTVNEVERANALFAIGVQGIFSDYPERFL